LTLILVRKRGKKRWVTVVKSLTNAGVWRMVTILGAMALRRDDHGQDLNVNVV